MIKNKSLTLIIPKLSSAISRKKYPFIARYFQRAQKRSLSVAEQLPALLCYLFKISVDEKNIPTAAITALADNLPAQTGWWLRMDPAELHADHANVFFVDTQHASCGDQAITTLKSFLATDGLTLHTPHPTRWYLQSDSDFKIQTISPHDARNQPLLDCLPTGEREKYWRQLFTEIQLLLHQEKTSRINSVWFWGEGKLPPVPVTKNYDVVKSTERLGLGLAQLAQVPCHEISEQTFQQGFSLPDNENTLIILDRLLDEETIKIFDTQWFQPLLLAVKKKQLTTVNLYIGDGHCYTLTLKQFSFFFQLCLL